MGNTENEKINASKYSNSCPVKNNHIANIGDGENKEFIITHNLNSLDVTVDIIECETGEVVLVDVAKNNSNTIKVSFSKVPTVHQYRITIKK